MTLTKYTTRAFIAVPAAQQAAANAACESVVKGGRGTFTVQWPPQDDTGAVLPRYYVCNWQMLPAERTALAAAFLAAGRDGHVLRLRFLRPGALSTVKYSAVDADLKSKTGTLSLAQVAALPDLAVITKTRLMARSWWVRLLRWFLKVWRWLRGKR